MLMMKLRALANAGNLPIRNKPARFAVGDQDGLTSNSWRVWVDKKANIYIACRDQFPEAKVSLHPSGRWRMGFTEEAIIARPDLLASPEDNRAWEVWDKPSEYLPQIIPAFHLYFPTSELAVQPAQRTEKLWKDVVLIEPGQPGKMTVLSLFITTGDVTPVYSSEPSFALASFELGNNQYAKLVAHTDPDDTVHELLSRLVSTAQREAASNGVQNIPPDAFFYFFGNCEGGARFLIGAKKIR
jgi:hypothetical protein